MKSSFRRLFELGRMNRGVLAGMSALTVVLLAGCSYFEKTPPPPPAAPTEFDIGLAHLASGNLPNAEEAFRRSASACESGSSGRHSLLFLSVLALDPRNPTAHPDSALLMAERFLNLPRNSREEMLQAEALYVAALDYGADPELRVDQANPGFAVRFGDCDAPFPGRDRRPLPTLEESMVGRLRSLDEERGSLYDENQQLLYTIGRLRQVRDSLTAQNDTLSSELDRIRQLIRLPDTLTTRRPDTTRPDTTLAQPATTAASLDELLRLLRSPSGPRP